MSSASPAQSTIQYRLSEWQADVFENRSRFRVIPAGRRAGKNELAATTFLDFAINPDEYPFGPDSPEGMTLWWVAPSYTQSRKYGFEKLLSMIPSAWIAGEPKYSEPYEIPLINGALLEFRTFDKPSTLQGAGVDYLVVDEVAYMKESLWTNDLRPMLMDSEGGALLISKPRGRNFFFRMWKRCGSDDFPTYWGRRATAFDNPFIKDSEIEAERSTTPEYDYRQEYLAEFLTDSGGVFEKVDERLKTDRYEFGSYAGEWPYSTGVDLARTSDHTVIITVDYQGDVIAIERVTNRDVTWDEIEEKVVQRFHTFPGLLSIDSTRDNKVVSDIAKRVPCDVDAVNFTSRKKSLIENLVVTFESGALSSPYHKQLFHELGVMEREVTPTTVKYHAAQGFHDDCVDAFALAVDKLEALSDIRARDEAKRRRSESGDVGVSYY